MPSLMVGKAHTGKVGDMMEEVVEPLAVKEEIIGAATEGESYGIRRPRNYNCQYKKIVPLQNRSGAQIKLKGDDFHE
ncbi:MAG: hypothetical protein ACHQ1H_06730 [Nitrososphaerales archaeon]